MKKILFILLTVWSLSISAQEKIPIDASDYTNQSVAMADEMRANGKIYVLTGVILIILIGTIFYLITIDRKVVRLENIMKNKE